MQYNPLSQQDKERLRESVREVLSSAGEALTETVSSPEAPKSLLADDSKTEVTSEKTKLNVHYAPFRMPSSKKHGQWVYIDVASASVNKEGKNLFVGSLPAGVGSFSFSQIFIEGEEERFAPAFKTFKIGVVKNGNAVLLLDVENAKDENLFLSLLKQHRTLRYTDTKTDFLLLDAGFVRVNPGDLLFIEFETLPLNDLKPARFFSLGFSIDQSVNKVPCYQKHTYIDATGEQAVSFRRNEFDRLYLVANDVGNDSLTVDGVKLFAEHNSNNYDLLKLMYDNNAVFSSDSSPYELLISGGEVMAVHTVYNCDTFIHVQELAKVKKASLESALRYDNYQTVYKMLFGIEPTVESLDTVINILDSATFSQKGVGYYDKYAYLEEVLNAQLTTQEVKREI